MKTLKHTLSALFAVLASIVMLPAMADLPSGYRQLDYVDTDGNQWVNTLFEPTCTNAVEIKASVANPNREQFLYCSRRATSSNSEQYRRWHSLCITGGKARFDYAYWHNETSTLTGGQAYVFAAMPEEKSGQEEIAESSKQWHLNMYIDDALVFTSGDRNFWVPVYDSSHQYFCLFGSYAGNLADDTTVASKAICRFYYFKVWDTKDKDNLLCHIVPVYGEAEGAVGLYDVVAGRFLPVHGKPFAAAQYTLAADEVWTNEVSDVTVDLAGNNLTLAADASVATNTASAFAGSDYEDLSYMLAVGKQAMQITGFSLPGTAKVEMKIRPTTLNGTQWLFSSRAGAGRNAYSALIYYTGSMRFDFNAAHTDGTTVLSPGDDYTLVFNGTTSKPTWYVNGTQEASHAATSNSFTGGGDLFLFGTSPSGTYYGRLYYFTVTTNNTVALDLRPVRRISDGVVGLYDTVGGTFYTSGAGTALPSLATPEFTNTSEITSELRVGQKFVSGYTRVDKIISGTSTAGNNGFVLTDYIPEATDRIEVKASLSDVSATYGLFCSRKNATTEMFNALYTISGVRFDFNAGSGEQKTTSFKPAEDEVFTVALDGNEKACYTNGAVAATFTSNSFIPSKQVYLFALIDASTGYSTARAPGAIYSFKAWGADGTLKVDMVSVVRDSDGVAGLYDRARRRFFGTAHPSYAFTAGTQVGDGKLYVDADNAFDETELPANITLVKEGEMEFDGRGTTLAGTLKIVAGTVGGVTMQSGAMLDLSELSGAFSLDDNAIAFADAAKIYVNIGSRTIAKNTPVVSWTSAPSNIGGLKFRLVADGEEQAMLVKTDGLYPAPKGLIISFR